MKKNLLLAICLFWGTYTKAQNLYFPPTMGNTWDTISPTSLGWCTNQIDTLYNYLQLEDSKAFIVLKDGKIALEKYFGTFTKDSLWYWASAGKTITSFLIGKAQEEGYLSINDTSSKYLGSGWTSCTKTQEDKIKIWNQLTMTTGLDDGVPDNHCTTPSCLVYKADPGTRWAYHNAPYTILKDVLQAATNQTPNAYTTSKLKNKTGMNGIWFMSGSDNVYLSNARSFVRFGLLMQNKCIWNTDTLLHDTAYYNQMINTSQQINRSYGYLWWLNGKSSFMIPSSQFVFPGSFAPDAPTDMYAALGKNGQILCIAPKEGLVVMRMGNNSPNTNSADVPTVLCNGIWKKLNAVMCTTTAIDQINKPNIDLYPNPVQDVLNIKCDENHTTTIYNQLGQAFATTISNQISTENMPAGLYVVEVKTPNEIIRKTIVKN